MKETRTRSRKEDIPRPKPVEKIELSAKHQRMRLILAAIFLAAGASAIAYGVFLMSAQEPGWCEIEASSSELNCGGDFVFQYDLGEGGASATAEYKALTALYSEAAQYAFRMFTNDVEFEGVHNIYYINRHPNEEIEVDDVLYRAFSVIQSYGDRSLYLGPAYEQYAGLFSCTEEYQAEEYDPYLNQAAADYYAAVADFANDVQMVNMELLGENRICLKVSEEYLAFAGINEIESFIDFFWMKNAFIADYLAEEILSAGYSKGCISSYDGFARNLDGSGDSYSYTFYDRAASVIYPAAQVQYSDSASIVYLRDYALNSIQAQYCYLYSNGDIRTAYLDTRDGLPKSACSDLVCYSYGESCSEILMRMIPLYITDALQTDGLSALAAEGVFSIYCENGSICYNDPALVLTPSLDAADVPYKAVLIQ